MFDIYTIIFLTLAIIIILLRLRSVLGRRTGRGRPPGITNDNAVGPPSRSTDTTPASAAAEPAEPVDGAERWKGIAEPGSSVASGLDAIARKDKSFSAKHFVRGAQTAYEMIVLAYAQGDRPTARRARAAGRPDATDRRSNGLCRERPGRTGLRRRIPGGTPEARVGRRPQHSDRRSLGGGRHGVDATIREGTRRATARPHSLSRPRSSSSWRSTSRARLVSVPEAA